MHCSESVIDVTWNPKKIGANSSDNSLWSWHHLKVTAVGNTFRLWFDTTELTAGGPIVDNNNPLLTGWVGVYNFRFDISNLTTYFDDLILTEEGVTATKGTTWGSLKALYR